MHDSEIEQWCQRNNWTELRQLEVGIWVAFPPGAVMETPLPLQVQKPKIKLFESILDLVLMILVTTTMFVIAVIMSPCFIEPIINSRRNKCS